MTSYIGTLARPMGRHSAALPRLLGHIAVQFLNWRRRRRDHVLLMRQPEYLLRDIGLERHEIDGALRGRDRYR
ncbi:hypothetical protein [Dongia sp.]|uniref:hypothetical protein n=1 Tax=Dongia sp. TaxID=1977262 RepID=UPI003753C4B3